MVPEYHWVWTSYWSTKCSVWLVSWWGCCSCKWFQWFSTNQNVYQPVAPFLSWPEHTWTRRNL